MSQFVNFTIEQYRIQRKYREQKRKKYLKQFQQLRQKLDVPLQSQNQNIMKQSVPQVSKAQPQHRPHIAPHNTMQENKPNKTQNQPQIQRQNKLLKQRLAQIDQEQRQKLTKFKSQMQKARTDYVNKLQILKQTQMAQKQKTQAKIKKIQQQIMISTKKNEQIAVYNKNVEEQLGSAYSMMQKYHLQIQNEYDKKLSDFDTIFNASNEKIQALQDQYNEQQFVSHTLQNDQIVQSMRNNAEKSEAEIQKILTDYNQLLQGKTEIVNQLDENNKMKQQEITKMASLEQKLKTVYEKINEQKKIYLNQNKKMAEQLLQIKDLLSKVMNAPTE